MSKPPARRVPSDDCEVVIDGEPYHPHEGEWVEVMPGMLVGELATFRGLLEMQVKFDAIQGEPDADLQAARLIEDNIRQSILSVRGRVLGWSWTDDLGRPLPQPGDDADVFARLRVEELFYLVAVLKGESPGERKNGSRPSPTTSLATPRRRSRA